MLLPIPPGFPEALRPFLPAAPYPPLDAGPDRAPVGLAAALEPWRDGSLAAALWLAHGDLTASHEVSQRLRTAEGSLWHAVMHRREGDFWNSKYWYRQAGPHPLYRELVRLAAERGLPFTSATAFVDECERLVTAGDATNTVAVMVQQLEWELLLAAGVPR